MIITIFKNGCNGEGGGDENFLVEMGRKPGMGGWFYNEGDEKFLKRLHIVGKGVLTPLFYEDLPILPTLLLFFKCCIPPSLQLHFPVTPNPHPHCSFCFLVITTHLMCHFNDDMDLHMSSFSTLVTEGP